MKWWGGFIASLPKELIQNVKSKTPLYSRQLRTSEREYSTIFEAICWGVVYLNKDAKNSKQSTRLQPIALWAWTRWDEMNENVSFDETLQPIEFDQLPISQSVKEGIEFKGKVVGLSFSDTTDIRWLSISTKLWIPDKMTITSTVFVTPSDISERKEFVDTLSESEYSTVRLTEN